MQHLRLHGGQPHAHAILALVVRRGVGGMLIGFGGELLPAKADHAGHWALGLIPLAVVSEGCRLDGTPVPWGMPGGL